MPLFSSSSPFDADVERATDEMNVEDNWSLILDICDRAKLSQSACKDCVRSIMKRLRHKVPYVPLQALTLLNACVKNCGHPFHLEIASRDFVSECRSLLNDRQTHIKVAQTLKMHIKAWAEGEFKSESSLSLIPSLYNSLKSEGHSFTPLDTPLKSKSCVPRELTSHCEEEDFVKAIAMSLKDAGKKSKSDHRVSGLYPSVNTASQPATQKHSVEPRKVRALYDFEAAEDNELTFQAGEVIGVIDDSDSNWWKGVSWRGEGLFPANFVTADLSVDVTVVDKTNQPTLETPDTVEQTPVPLKIDEEKIDHTLLMIQNADPTAEDSSDPPEMSSLEEIVQCRNMGPMIDQELEKIDRLHGQLSELNNQLMVSLQMYNNLMHQDFPQAIGQAGYPTPSQFVGHQGTSVAPVQQVEAPYNQYNFGAPPPIATNFVNASSGGTIHYTDTSTLGPPPSYQIGAQPTSPIVYGGSNQQNM